MALVSQVEVVESIDSLNPKESYLKISGLFFANVYVTNNRTNVIIPMAIPNMPQENRNMIWIISATNLIRHVNTMSLPDVSKYTMSISGCCIVMRSINNDKTMMMRDAKISRYMFPKVKHAAKKLSCCGLTYRKYKRRREEMSVN